MIRRIATGLGIATACWLAIIAAAIGYALARDRDPWRLARWAEEAVGGVNLGLGGRR